MERFPKPVKKDCWRNWRWFKGNEGISKVRISGYPVEELEISVRENDLKKYNLSFQDLHRAIISENIDFTGGTVKSIDENFKIRSNNKKYNSDEIAEIIVKKINNRIIKIKDVATVKRIWQDVSNRKYYNNTSGVVINVFNTNNEDITIVSSKTRSYLKNFNNISTNITADIIQDNSIIIEQEYHFLQKME